MGLKYVLDIFGIYTVLGTSLQTVSRAYFDFRHRKGKCIEGVLDHQRVRFGYLLGVLENAIYTKRRKDLITVIARVVGIVAQQIAHIRIYPISNANPYMPHSVFNSCLLSPFLI